MIEFVTPGGNICKIDIVTSLIFIVLVYIVVSIVKWCRLMKLKRRFQQKDTGHEFVAKCEKEIKIYCLRGNEYPHNLLCVMLCATYLENGDVDAFFKWLNALKPSGVEAEYMVNILFIQFYTEINYIDISKRYPINTTEYDKSILREVLQEYVPCFVDEDKKTETIENMVHNEFVKQCFSSFQEAYER